MDAGVIETAQNPLLQLVTVFSMGAITAYGFHRLKLPTVLGFILTGVLLGPSVLNWISSDQIAILSELGIIFLLFLVGLELSITKIKRLKFQAPLAGLLQLSFSGLLLFIFFKWGIGMPGQLAFLLGSILTLSSTAIVLKRLEERREMDSLHGRVILAILIIQDLAIIPLMTLVSSLSTPLPTGGADFAMLMSMGFVIGKALLAAVLVVITSLKLLPLVMDKLAGSNQKEIFLLTVISLVLGASWLTHLLGISYEAGALIAGISLSGSLFAHQVFADSRAYRDVFVMLFFVSLGLWVDTHFLVAHWQDVLGLALVIFTIKSLSTFFAIRLAGFHVKNGIWGALSLFQVGEFSVVALTNFFKSVAIIPAWQPWLEIWSPLLSNTIVLTMFITPLVMAAIPSIIKSYDNIRSRRITLENLTHSADEAAHLQARKQQNLDSDSFNPDAVVAGYGPSARHVCKALKNLGMSYRIIEMNAQTIKLLQELDEPAIYGDVSHPDILVSAGIETARFFILTFPDLKAAQAAISQAKRLNPDITVLARARYQMDVPKLHQIGAKQVICEEFETGLDFVAGIMRHTNSNERDITLMLDTLRLDSPSQFVQSYPGDAIPLSFGRSSLVGSLKIEWLIIPSQSSLIGQTVADSRLRLETGVTILSVLKASSDQAALSDTPEPNYQVDPGYVFAAGDTLVAIGSWEQLKALERFAGL